MSQRLVILGAGTALPDRDRDNTFLVWESPAGGLLIDCAGRAYQQLLRADIDPRSLRGALLTHNHPDHIYGLPAFLFHLWLAQYPHPFDVYANASTLSMARRLCDALELEQDGYMCETRWHELPESVDHQVLATEAYTIATTPVRHTRPTLAVKIIDHERQQTLVYSADTQPCPELEQFARGVHTLIHEATVTDPVTNYGHTTPRQVGEIAARCGVRRVALIHYSAEYTLPEEQAIAEVRAGGFTGDVSLTRELETYRL
jgi:ribonuclease Z